MPELPDVETFKRYIQSTSLHQPIQRVESLEARLVKNTSRPALCRALMDRSLEEPRRHGKYLFLRTDGDPILLLHFGMTGRPHYYRDPEQEPDYPVLYLVFENGYRLAYSAPRKLGEIRLLKDIGAFIRQKGLGPDPIADDMTEEDFRGRLEGRRGTVKGALMDQSCIAGIGNEYSNEILFQMRLHPKADMRALDVGDREDLYLTTLGVLRTAIDAGAEKVRFPDSYLLKHQFGDGKCPGCGGEIQRMEVLGRGTYWCPSCQEA
ncbi:MAG: DNA-formamidopyrimidine glycosylase family protein [bacterium]